MTTVQQIYDMAIHLLDEQNESTGETVTEDTDEYRFRTISILNSIIPVLYPFSSGYDPADPPMALDVSDYQNPAFDQIIQLDDRLSLVLLPPYLAAKLIQAENETLSALCLNQYRESFQQLRDHSPGSWEKIIPFYGYF